MSRIVEIEIKEDRITIWTIGSDDFHIYADEFKEVRKAMRDWKSKNKKETLEEGK